MPNNEAEEFEFRLRSEKESASKPAPAPAPAAAPAPTGIAGFPRVIGNIASGAASNLVDAGRGAIAGTISMPGEMSKLAQQGANWANSKMGGSPSYWNEKTWMPEFKGTVDAVPRLGTSPTKQTEGFETLGSMAAPVPGSGLVKGAMKVPGAIGKGVGVVSESMRLPTETIALAQRAQAAGIPLRPDMLTNSKFLRFVGDALETVPMSGDKLAQRQIKYNQAVMDTIGADATQTKLTPSVFNAAITKSGETIGELSSKYPVPMSDYFKASLAQLRETSGFETADVSKILNKYVNEINVSEKAGVVDGTQFRKIRTQLTSQMRRTSNGDLKHALSELDDVMLEQIKGGLKPEELAPFNQARKQYANAKTLEPLIAKGEGDIRASDLMSRVTATGSGKSAMARDRGGDLGEIARIGQKFMNNPVNRALSTGSTLGGLGSGIVAPGTTAGVLGAANLYNRVAPGIARRMIKPPIAP